MKSSLNSVGLHDRPYRSHLQPACLACRKRKSRCKGEPSSARCAMCGFHGTECVYPESRPSNSDDPPAKRVKRTYFSQSSEDANPVTQSKLADSKRSLNQGSSFGCTPAETLVREAGAQRVPEQTAIIGNGALDETDGDNIHVVGPAMANDDEILETYLSSTPMAGLSRRSIQTESSRQTRPVMFTTVPRRPLGVTKNHTLSASKCEVIEKLIEPHQKDIVRLYLDTANVALPIFDMTQFLELYTNHKDKISPALLSNLYANAMVYWMKSNPNPPLWRPDGRFIWVQAHEALHSETFLSPGISTVMALILNVSGRPTTSPFNNGGMIGTAVALAHALGLNRDPTKWKISEAEKDMRLRIWWQVVVQDRWCSWSYGTPPQIQTSQYDTPLPNIHAVSRSSSPADVRAATIFMSFLTLTEVLGHLLEHVYDLRAAGPYKDRSSARLEYLLISWKNSLSSDVKSIVNHGDQLNISGSANLRLAFLAVELLLCRIQLDLDKQALEETSDTSAKHCLIRAQRAAEDIVHFVRGLDEEHIRGFWMPQSSATLTSATAFLLRNAIRSISAESVVDQNPPLQMATVMVETLRCYQRDYDWDIADHCVAQFGDFVDHMAAMRCSDGAHTPGRIDVQDFEAFMADSVDLQANDFDSIVPSLWDIFES